MTHLSHCSKFIYKVFTLIKEWCAACTGLRWSLKYTGLESGLHPNDEDWHVWGKDDLRQSWGQYWKYKANMQDFQKPDKVMCVFFPLLQICAPS